MASLPDPQPDLRFQTVTLRVPVDAMPVVRLALQRFYAGTRRPLTDPVAYGYMLEMLAADFLAGPTAAHPRGDRRLRQNPVVGPAPAPDQKETP